MIKGPTPSGVPLPVRRCPRAARGPDQNDATRPLRAPVALPHHCAPISMTGSERASRWKRSLRLIAILLAGWFIASLGLGVLLAGPLNRVWVGGFPLGFWFAQQGSILIFLFLLVVNAVVMDRIEGGIKGDGESEDRS